MKAWQVFVGMVAAAAGQTYGSPSPCAVAQSMVVQMLHDERFAQQFIGDDSYGASLTIDGMFEIASACPNISSQAQIIQHLDNHLDLALKDSTRFAYKALHNIPISPIPTEGYRGRVGINGI